MDGGQGDMTLGTFRFILPFFPSSLTQPPLQLIPYQKLKKHIVSESGIYTTLLQGLLLGFFFPLLPFFYMRAPRPEAFFSDEYAAVSSSSSSSSSGEGGLGLGGSVVFS